MYFSNFKSKYLEIDKSGLTICFSFGNKLSKRSWIWEFWLPGGEGVNMQSAMSVCAAVNLCTNSSRLPTIIQRDIDGPTSPDVTWLPVGAADSIRILIIL